MKYLQIGLLFLAAFLIQPSLLNVINIEGYTPNLILCLTILSTFLYEEEIYGVIFGAIFGILYDIMYSNVVGPMPISLILVALGIIIVREYTNIENIINMWAVSIVSILAFYFMNWGLHHIAGNPVGFRFVFNSVPWIALYSLAVITILYRILVRKLAKHRRDRYIR